MKLNVQASDLWTQSNEDMVIKALKTMARRARREGGPRYVSGFTGMIDGHKEGWVKIDVQTNRIILQTRSLRASLRH